MFLLALQTQRRPGEKYGNLEFRKGLLSELQETYLCLLRAEPDHIKHQIDDHGLILYQLDKKDPVEMLFYSTFLSRLNQQLSDFPQISQKMLRSTFFYRLLSQNF